ncbi:hypothetical protein [Ruficoccus sp. ZRK36]|uniref:hypothetical protein n=1 Tax=Ruficoccus sp. ZRK36 TaxID=2866311 RepID=UPI001C73A53B|nr:hypothetical protein [Ruficoccus sp. ZRK36]QYY37080.1 hypothetical protein K0V07_06260 [Ruficoccus sp. ZRK36]
MKVTPDSLGITPENIIYWGLHLDDDVPLSKQTEALKEDLAQIKCPHEHLLDIGWYPSYSPEGFFGIVVAKTNNWGSPVYRKKAHCIETLRDAVRDAMKVAS